VLAAPAVLAIMKNYILGSLGNDLDVQNP
jgi:hypothetical protein